MKQAHFQHQNPVGQFNPSDSEPEPKIKTQESSFGFRILRVHYPEIESLIMAETKLVVNLQLKVNW